MRELGLNFKDASLVLSRLNAVEAQLAGNVTVSELLGGPGGSIVSRCYVDPEGEANIALIRFSRQRFSVAETIHMVRCA